MASNIVYENPITISNLHCPFDALVLHQTQFHKWYDKFKHLTLKSFTIPLTNEFINFIEADSLPSRVIDDSNILDNYDDNDDSITIATPLFPELEHSINTCITKLGGISFPKLNWSAPIDASWAKPGMDFKCSSHNDIFLLLRGSEAVGNFDLSNEIRNAVKKIDLNFSYYLVLREWRDLEPSLEFRCFVKNRTLIAVCQRNCYDYYGFLKEQKTNILENIDDFFKKNIQNKFEPKNFVFDVYFEKFEKVLLIDFNSFGELTQPLLFSWEELNSDNLDGTNLELRLNEESMGIQLNLKLDCSRYPTDITDIASGGDVEILTEFLNISKVKLQ